MNSENIYWIALSGIKKFNTERINKILIKIFIDNKSNLSEFFNLNIEEYKSIYSMDNEEVDNIISVKNNISDYMQIQKDLELQGIEIIPLNSELYSKQLKLSLKTGRTPSVLYVKGNKKLLNKSSAAVVGARNSSNYSLEFTDHIVKNLTGKNKVIISGFAKGVDRQALDSALKYNGESIIVLPQGILTFKSELRKYSDKIKEGKLLVLSTYFPKSPWSVPLAMGRNSIIYGLSEEIYVAESNFKGGTWSGVLEGLKRNQRIFVRNPAEFENNANRKLIDLGAISIEWDMQSNVEIENQTLQVSDKSIINTEELIMDYLSVNPKTSKKIKDFLKINWSANKITSFLKNQDNVEIIKGKPMMFCKKSQKIQDTLFNQS